MEIVESKKFYKLVDILKKYPDLLEEMDIVKVDVQILEAYIYNKSLTAIEIEYGDHERVLMFLKEINEFFFTIHAQYDPNLEEHGFNGEIFVTRFKNVHNIIKFLVEKDLNENEGILSKGFTDKIADILGILLGTNPKQVARYCNDGGLDLTK